MSNIVAKLVLAAGLLAALAPPAAAGSITLENLLQGGSIQVGNQTFTNFGNFAVAHYGGAGVDPNLIYVTPVVHGSQVGLTFQSVQFSVTSLQSLGIHLDFDVTSAAGSVLHSSALGFQAAGYNSGSAKINAALNGAGNLLTVSTASGTYQSSAPIPSGPAAFHTSLDISLFGGVRPTGSAQICEFTIMFDNPEPASITLLGIGVVGVLGYGWRRRSHCAWSSRPNIQA